MHAVCEQGFAGVSVASICARAKVSKRTFYETFDSREDCFLAALDEGHRRASVLVSRAFDGGDSWLDGLRIALAELLLFFDAEPQLARVCIVESLATGPWALERREQHVRAFTELIVHRSGLAATGKSHQFASEGVIAAVLGAVQNHLLTENPAPLSGLLAPLMGLATAPYLDSQSVREELERSGALARQLQATRTRPTPDGPAGRPVVPALLENPRAHRARACVLYLADNPGSSNRQIARAVGVKRDTQISTMLARLNQTGLLTRGERRPGGSNAWSLSRRGLAVARALGDSASKPGTAAGGDATG